MSEIAIVWIQLIVGLFAFGFLARWLVKLTKPPTVGTSSCNILLIWTDGGGLFQAEKFGFGSILGSLLLNVIVFGAFFLIVYFVTNTSDYK